MVNVAIRSVAAMLATSGLVENVRADLIGVNYSNGEVFSISTHDATATRLGQAPTGIMGLDRAPDGRLLAITDGISGSFGVLDELSWNLEPVGNLSAGFTSEGALAYNAQGDLFGGMALAGGGRAIFEIDPATGRAGRSVTLSRSSVDLNGLFFRDDGALVAIDRVANELVSVDTSGGDVSVIASLISPGIGAVGGLAVDDGIGYYVTAGTSSGADGDNSLYQIDLFTGEQRLIGSLGPDAGSGFGIGAVAGGVVPAPGAIALFAGGGSLALLRRRRVR